MKNISPSLTPDSSNVIECFQMIPCFRVLPTDIRHLLKALIQVLVPPTDQLPLEGIEEKIVSDADRLLFEFPKLFQWGLIWGMRLFNGLPFIFGFGLMTFVSLSAISQKKYVDGWAQSKIIIKREFFKTLKAFVLLVYFSDKRVWEYIGYDPEPHMKERIKLREEILKRNS